MKSDSKSLSGTDVERIWIDKIDEHDLKAMQKVVSVIPYGYSVEHVLKWIAGHDMQLWRGQDEKGHRFVIITEILVHPAGKELFIWGVGGRGYIRSIGRAYKALEDYAKANDIRWIAGMTSREGLDKEYDKRFNTVATRTTKILEIGK